MHRLRFFSEKHREWVTALFGKVRSHYGKDLVSLALYGSYARRENRMNSDIDLVVILNSSPGGRLQRQEDFVKHVEFPIETLAVDCGKEGLQTDVSSLILSRNEASGFLPIYLDMVAHHVLIVDRDRFMEEILRKTAEKMKRWGSLRKEAGGHWYWEIRPGLRWNEAIDYDQ